MRPTKHILKARVNPDKFETASRSALHISARANIHASSVELGDCRKFKSENVSSQVRVICGLKPSPSAAVSLGRDDTARNQFLDV